MSPKINRRNLWPWILVLILTLGTMTAVANFYVLGELVIKMEEGQSIDLVNGQFGTSVGQHLPQLDVYLLYCPTGANQDSLAAAIEALPEVEFCHPNYLVDPLQPVQSSLPVSDDTGGDLYYSQEAVSTLNLTVVHTFSTGSDVKVGILDGGVNDQHPVLLGSVQSSYDYVDDDPYADDELGGANSGHGSFLAGVVHLVAPDAEIYAYRVTDTAGESNGYIVAEAILQAVDDGCDVLNLSMVMMGEHEAIASAVAYARDNDVLTIVAAGNGQADTATYPASDNNTIAVAAVDSTTQLADFSSFGDHVDICAPGTDIYAPYQGDGYAWWGGTSFASPFVAAQAALIISMDTALTWEQVRNAIIGTAINIDDYNVGYEGMIGAGLMDPLASLELFTAGSVIHVPGDYTSIQAAIIAAADGDSILVGPGTYMENIDFLGKTIKLIGSGGIDNYATYLQPAWPFIYTVLINSGEGQGTQFSGFVVENGGDIQTMLLQNTSVLISDNVFRNNILEGGNNKALIHVFTGVGAPRIEGNLFYNNGGISCVGISTSAYAEIIGNTMDNNARGYHTISANGGVARYNSVTNSTEYGVYGTFSDHDCNNIYNNNPDYDGGAVAAPNDVSGDPLFCDPASSNYNVAPTSPNAPANNNCGDYIGVFSDICDGCWDGDADSLCADVDNCPLTYNPGQEDADGDGVGDVCDLCPGYDDHQDADSDSHADGCDNCPDTANFNQTDIDGDGIGLACDDCVDEDGDGFGDPAYSNSICGSDNCLNDYNPGQEDSDADGWGDSCDLCPGFYSTDNSDNDHDGIGTVCDNCPYASNPDQADTNSNGIGDACEGAEEVCGNVNCDQSVNPDIIDLTHLLDLLYINHIPLECPDNAEMDDYFGVTNNDVVALINHMFRDMQPLSCDPYLDPPFPVSANDTVELRNTVIPAGMMTWTVELWSNTAEPYYGLSFPFRYDTSGTPVRMDSVHIELESSNGIHLRDYNSETFTGFVVIEGLSSGFSADFLHIATFHFSNTFGVAERVIVLDTVSSPNTGNVVLSDISASQPVIPIIVGLASSTDSDGDGVTNDQDNCPTVANPGQDDADSDGVGDACDNCPAVANVDQADADDDGLGDLCDACPDDPANDEDTDGICGDVDNCPTVANADQADADGDGFGDLCDVCPGYDDGQDADGDAVPDGCDNCPTVANASQTDADEDGAGDACDPCPNDPADTCSMSCTLAGDVNFDTEVGVGDLTYLIDYVYMGGAVPQVPANADCDDYLGIGTRDIMFLHSFLQGTGPQVTCPPTQSTLPAIDSSIVLSFPSTVPAYTVQMAIPLTLSAPVEVLAFNFPLVISVDGLPVAVDSLVPSSFYTSGEGYFWELKPQEVFRQGTNGTILVGAAAFYGSPGLSIGSNPLATLFITVEPSAEDRELITGWGSITPIQSLPGNYPEEGLYPVVISPGSFVPKSARSGAALADPSGFLPQFGPVLGGGNCCLGDRGNVQLFPDCSPVDQTVDIADLTNLIDHLFISYAPYCCLEEADIAPAVSGGQPDAMVDIADLTALIDHLFINYPTLPTCGDVAAPSAGVIADPDISINTIFENDRTTIEVDSRVDLRGLQLELIGPDGATLVNLMKGKLDLLYGVDNGVTKLGVVDLDGGELIKTGVTPVIHLEGEFTITSALVSDLRHNSITPTIEAVTKPNSLPDRYALHQNYPNPFNPATEIAFDLPGASHVTLDIYNIMGQKVTTLVNKSLEAGQHSATWNGCDDRSQPVASGVYFFRLTAENYSDSKKMLLLK